jgi:hypothetical protein
MVVDVKATSWLLYSRKEIRNPFYWRLGGPQGRSSQVLRTSPPPGYDLGTAQHLATHCTLYTVLALKTESKNFPVRAIKAD